LQENVGALDVALTTKDLAHIDEVAPQDAVAGARYPDWAMATVNR
jgi:aryl-alcohol dehydrogenase-like predicted oxidoreductase